jgi:hypothetical protein
VTVPAPDLSLLRFLRARVDETETLNQSEVRSPRSEVNGQPGLAGELVRAARALPVGDGGAVAYSAIAASPQFREYRELAARLVLLDPAALQGCAERTAFWLNLANALVIDAVISYGVRESVRERPGFFRRAAYRVGPYRFSLEEIEHGLLRDNRPVLPGLPAPFPEHDPRTRLGPGELDPRVHFALNCGTRSCPPVAFYEAGRLDEQLEAAASSFISTEGVRVVEGEAVVSPLFEFYRDDFGGIAGILDWLRRYCTDEEALRLLDAGCFRFGVYDWSLNR